MHVQSIREIATPYNETFAGPEKGPKEKKGQ